VGNHCESGDDDETENRLPWLDDAGKAELDAGRRLDAGASAGDAGRDAGDAGRDAGDAGRASDGGDAAFAITIDPATTCLGSPNRFAIAGDDFIYTGPGLILELDGGPSGFATDDAGMAREIDFSFGQDYWHLSLSTRSLDAGMVAGLYADAERAPFASSGHPGLSVSGRGAGCNTLSGQFEILEISVQGADPDAGLSAKLKSLHARFEQHCERQTRSNVGCVHYTAATP
jgi:hypothetical protein